MADASGAQGQKPSERENHISYLFAAELQFRLASAVRLATIFERQPLDLPTEWTHGKQRVKYGEVALRQDQAAYASFFLQRSTTYIMAVAIREVIPAALPDYRKDPLAASAFEIAYEVRNAFAHAPFFPVWRMHKRNKGQVFVVPRIIRLDTRNIDGKPFDWKDYGGPLALLRLCRFVRIKMLKDTQNTRRKLERPKFTMYLMGDLILQKIDGIPAGARRIYPTPLPDGSIPIPGADGYSIGRTGRK